MPAKTTTIFQRLGSRDKSILALIILAAATLSQVLVLQVPSAVYSHNRPYLRYDSIDYLLLQIPIILGLTLAISAPCVLAPRRSSKHCALVLSFVAFLFWITANFVTPHTIDLGLLDGSAKTLSIPVRVVLMETFAIAISAVVYVALFTTRHKIILSFLVMFNLFLLIPPGITTFNDLIERNDHSEQRSSEVVDFFRFSEEKNLLIVLLDEFQSDFMDELLRENPAQGKVFDGFTFFKDTLAGAPTTYVSMPVIHSGRYYRPGESLSDFYREGVREGSFLVGLANRGADVSLINSMMNVCPDGAACLGPLEVLVSRREGAMKELALLLDVALLRAVPHAVKPAVFNEGSWLISRWLGDDLGLHEAVAGNEMMRTLADELYVAGTRPAVKFIHITGTHRPYLLDRDCRILEWAPYDREHAMNVARCAISELNEVLNSLKERHAYDHTMIVLLADHGAGGPTQELTSSPEPTIITVAEDYSFRYKSSRKTWESWWPAARLNPLFMVKPLGARGALVENEVNAVSLSDVKATVCVFLESCEAGINGSAFEQPAASQRERMFSDYVWKHEYWEEGSIDNLVERRVSRSIRDLIEDRQYVEMDETRLSFTQPVPSLRGLSSVEPWGTWTDGKEASLAFDFESVPTKAVVLAISAYAFVHEHYPRQEVDVVVNDVFVGRWTWTYGTTPPVVEKQVTIPLDVVLKRQPMIVTLQMRNAISGKALGVSAGTRVLGIGLTSLALRPVGGG